MEKLSDDDKRKLAKAKEKAERKAAKRLEIGLPEVKPTGTKKALKFTRVSKGRKKRWSRQYMIHRQTGTLVKVEIKE